jgi:hypothetical protein
MSRLSREFDNQYTTERICCYEKQSIHVRVIPREHAPCLVQHGRHSDDVIDDSPHHNMPHALDKESVLGQLAISRPFAISYAPFHT